MYIIEFTQYNIEGGLLKERTIEGVYEGVLSKDYTKNLNLNIILTLRWYISVGF